MNKVKRRFAAALGNKYADILDELFGMLVDFLKQFLEGCMAKDVKELAHDKEAFVERKLTQKLVSEGYSRSEAKAIAKAGIVTINKSSAADIESL